MKKKNGFTLIELLAIIVILAIIAVITVPIILNIIESSKKGAIKDSAYGYKDSVNKWYVSKLTEDPNYVLNDGTYSVSELGATVEGKQPADNSWVTISKTNVTDGCLQFDEYKVEISNGEVGEASVGECMVPTIKAVVYSNKGDSTPKTISNPLSDLVIGDYVTIGANDNENGFYVISVPSDSNGTVLLLSEYNLNSEGRQEPSSAYKYSNFSSEQYWVYCLDENDQYCSSNQYAYKDEYPQDTYGYRYVYTKDESNQLYTYINSYNTYLSEIVKVYVSDARLMSYEEAINAGCSSSSCPTWLSNQSYALGSEGGAGNIDLSYSLWYIHAPRHAFDKRPYDFAFSYYEDHDAIGVRPVIEVPLSVF